MQLTIKFTKTGFKRLRLQDVWQMTFFQPDLFPLELSVFVKGERKRVDSLGEDFIMTDLEDVKRNIAVADYTHDGKAIVLRCKVRTNYVCSFCCC
jgi:hypothetical protein